MFSFAYVCFITNHVKKVVPISYIKDFHPKHECDVKPDHVYKVLWEDEPPNTVDLFPSQDESQDETQDLNWMNAVVLKIGSSRTALLKEISEKRVHVPNRAILKDITTPELRTNQNAIGRKRLQCAETKKPRQEILTNDSDLKKTHQANERKRMADVEDKTKNSRLKAILEERLSIKRPLLAIDSKKYDDEISSDDSDEELVFKSNVTVLEKENNCLKNRWEHLFNENLKLKAQISSLETAMLDKNKLLSNLEKEAVILRQLNLKLQVKFFEVAQTGRKENAQNLDNLASGSNSDKGTVSPQLTNLEEKTNTPRPTSGRDVICPRIIDFEKERSTPVSSKVIVEDKSDVTIADNMAFTAGSSDTAQPLTMNEQKYQAKDGMVHLGADIFVKEEVWNYIMNQRKASLVIKNTAVAIWTVEKLMKRSVSGGSSLKVAKPNHTIEGPLTPAKIDIVKEVAAHYMNARKFTERDICAVKKDLNKIIGEKIADLRRKRSKTQ